jgi:glucose/arabinose dehydrogenase
MQDFLLALTAALSLCWVGGVVAPPSTPVINEPVVGKLINPADVHMEALGYSDPDGQAHASSDWEIVKTAAAAVVWQAPGVSGLNAVHIHLADGAFVGPYSGRTEMEFDTGYLLRCRFRDAAGETSAWSERAFRTSSAGPPGQPGPNPWVPAPGFVVEVVAAGFRLPTNIAFIPNPGPNLGDPLFYVTELYGTIKVVFRNGTVGTYASGLLNFNPTGAFPGSGEEGLAGICVDPATGQIYVTLPYASSAAGSPHYPKVMRFTSADGGRTASSSTTILDMAGEAQGPSHQISHISIGPDGKLYVHNGDGFATASALDLNSFRGKILRMNLDGRAPRDNPFYDASDGIHARNYVLAYGVRNPFGGTWRASDGSHYEIENGPSVDRLAKVVTGRNFGWDGTDESMSTFASYNWNPAHAPVNGAFIQPSTFGGSGFPGNRMDRLYVTESGPTYATGPQALGKRIVEFTLDAAGSLIAGPSTVVEYNGTGHATAVALAAGPDGLYFSDLYKDQGAATPTDAGAQILRLRWVGVPQGASSTPSGGGAGCGALGLEALLVVALLARRKRAP